MLCTSMPRCHVQCRYIRPARKAEKHARLRHMHMGHVDSAGTQTSFHFWLSDIIVPSAVVAEKGYQGSRTNDEHRSGAGNR